MRTHVIVGGVSAAIIVALGGGAGAVAEDYEIKLTRAAAVGQKYLFVASAGSNETVVTTVDGQSGPAEETVMSAEITGRLTVLAVSPAGKELKASLVVEKSKCAAAGITSEIVRPGTTVIAERGEGTNYSVNDSPVAPRAARCLKLVVPFSGGDSANDDAIFGTRKRQKIGSAWSMNAALAAEDLFKTSGLKVDPKDVTGTTRLIEVTSLNQRPALRLNGEMVMRNVAVPLPPVVSVKSSEFRATLSAVLPVDPAGTDRQMDMTMSGRVECEGGANGRTIRLVLITNQHLNQTMTAEPATDPARVPGSTSVIR